MLRQPQPEFGNDKFLVLHSKNAQLRFPWAESPSPSQSSRVLSIPQSVKSGIWVPSKTHDCVKVEIY